MFVGLPSTVDRLALDGILDYDAEAYINGRPPRFVGGQETYLPFEQPLCTFQPNLTLPPNPYGNVRLLRQPNNDHFRKGPYGIERPGEHPPEDGSKTPSWKKLLALALGGTILALGGYKAFKFIKNRKAAKAAAAAQNGTAPVWYKQPFTWIKSKFSKKSNPPKP